MKNKNNYAKQSMPYVILLLVIVGSLVFFRLSQYEVHDLSYDKFMTELQNGEVKKIEITTKNGVKKTGNLVTGDILIITSNNITKKITISIKGDTNGDGKINSVDLFRIQKHISNYTKLTGPNKESADTNYDGKINSVDLFRTKKHITGYITLK